MNNPMNNLMKTLENACSEAVLSTKSGPEGDVILFKADSVRRIFETIKECSSENGRVLLSDISAVNFENGDCRFELFYHLFFIDLRQRIALKCRLSENRIDSISDIMPAALMPEREIFDMFGLKFTGLPEQPRLFMHNEFEGPPLLREYPLLIRQISLERTRFE